MKSLRRQDLKGQERANFLVAIPALLQRGEITLGQAVRVLRAGFLGVGRARFSAMVGVSPRQLAKLEADEGNPTVGTLTQVFKPFGLRVGLVARDGLSGEVSDGDLAAWRQAIEAAVAANQRTTSR